MSRPMEIEVWQGDWGLPSIDIDCLQIMVYGKMCGAPIQKKIRNNPFCGTLPTFRHGTAKLHKLQDVVVYLKSKGYDADHSLSTKQISQIEAYDVMLKEKLYPGLQFVWWVDTKNYIGLSRPWYAKALPFPFNYYYPGSYESNAKNLISLVYGSPEENYNEVETQAYGEAEKCLTLLSNRLGDSNYFLGNQPSSLDAIVFSYLAPLLKTPFPNPTLQNHLKACANLVSFIARISQKYYPETSQQYEKKQHAEMEAMSKEEEFPHRTRNQIIAGLAAVAAMTGYAYSSGLLQVSFDKDDPYDIDLMTEDPEVEDED